MRIPVKPATKTTGKLPPPSKVSRSEATRVFAFYSTSVAVVSVVDARQFSAFLHRH